MDRFTKGVQAANKEVAVRILKDKLMNARWEEIATKVVPSVPFEELSIILRDEAKRLTGSSIGFMGYIDLGTGRLISPKMNDEDLECCVHVRDSLSTKSNGLWGFGLKNRVPVMSNDLRRDPRACGLPTGHIPIGRFVSAPALAGDGGPVLGIVAVANADREYGMGDQAIIQRLAGIYALALERMWREEHGIDCRSRENERCRIAETVPVEGRCPVTFH